MRLTGVRVLFTFMLLATSGAVAARPHILFVGNSLTYVGNVPALLEALAEANGKSVDTQMIVKGGGTLSDRATDGSVQRALEAEDYDLVILQERGGDFLCSFGPESCANARSALDTLRRLAVGKGATPVLLGTYQGNADASAEIVELESKAAQSLNVAYLSVSDVLQHGLGAHPDFHWYASDGMHPGPALALLDAVVVYNHLFGTWPRAETLEVDAPIYGPSARFGPVVIEPKSLKPDGVRTFIAYPAEVVGAIVLLVKSSRGNG